MNKEEKILELANKNNGIITTKEVLKNNINRVFLSIILKFF